MLTGYIELESGYWFKTGRLTGRVALKGGYWYMVFNCVTEDGKPRPKWETTKLIERNNKTNAKKMLTEELARYNSMTPALSHIAFVELIPMWRSRTNGRYATTEVKHTAQLLNCMLFRILRKWSFVSMK